MNAIFVISEYDIKTGFGAVSFKTKTNLYTKIFDFAEPIDKFIMIVLMKYYKDQQKELKIGVPIDIVVDDKGNFVDVILPTPQGD